MRTRDQYQKALFGSAKVTAVGTVVEWRKKGGQLGQMFARIRERATELGFERIKADQFNTPDGSTIGSGDSYRDPDGAILSFTQSYGVVAYDNWFSCTLTLPDRQWKLEQWTVNGTFTGYRIFRVEEGQVVVHKGFTFDCHKQGDYLRALADAEAELARVNAEVAHV